MGKTGSNAFTLIELLVVIAVMALTGTVILANYRSFGEEQKLTNAVLDIQSQLRSAQTNATANVKCKSKTAFLWQLAFFFNPTTIYLRCWEQSMNVLDKKITLDASITVNSVSGTGTSCPAGPPASFAISFAPLTGQVTLGSTSCTSLTITLKNNKTGNTKSLVIEKGGRIYAP